MGRRDRRRDPWPDPPPRGVDADAPCALCDRRVPRRLITLHHLLPRQKGGLAEHRVPMCRPCHKTVHATFDNAELARRFVSVEALRDCHELRGYLAWIRRQAPDRNFAVEMNRAHPGDKRRRLSQRRRFRGK